MQQIKQINLWGKDDESWFYFFGFKALLVITSKLLCTWTIFKAIRGHVTRKLESEISGSKCTKKQSAQSCSESAALHLISTWTHKSWAQSGRPARAGSSRRRTRHHLVRVHEGNAIRPDGRRGAWRERGTQSRRGHAVLRVAARFTRRVLPTRVAVLPNERAVLVKLPWRYK